MLDFLFDDDFPLYGGTDDLCHDWLYGDDFPYSLYVYPRERDHWTHRLDYTTPEGVELEVCTYMYHVGTYYKGRLIAMVHYPTVVRDIKRRGGNCFYIDFPWGGSHIRIHFDHIEYIDGYYHGTEIAEEGFLPQEVLQWREEQARRRDAFQSVRARMEQLAARRARRRARLAVMARAAKRRHRQRERAARLLLHIKYIPAPTRTTTCRGAKFRARHRMVQLAARMENQWVTSAKPRGPPRVRGYSNWRIQENIDIAVQNENSPGAGV